MTVEEIRIATSITVAFLSKEIFAAIGPMTQSVKTEKDPRTAMIEPNSGMSIDTVTARKRKLIRSQATNTRLSERLSLRASVTDSFWSASKPSSGVWESRPHEASNARLRALVPRGNLVLCQKIRQVCGVQHKILAYKGVTTSIQSTSSFNIGLYPGT